MLCKNPDRNVVKIRVEKITKDLPDIWAIREAQYDLWLEAVRAEEFRVDEKLDEFDWSDGSFPTEPPVSDIEYPSNRLAEEYDVNAEKEVQAVVEKVWGLGSMKVGQELTVVGSPGESTCGTAGLLVPGATHIFWVSQDTTSWRLWLCHLFNLESGVDAAEKYFDSIKNLKC